MQNMIIVLLQYNRVFDVTVSVDKSGMVEYWSGPKRDYKFPTKLPWEYKTDTDLYEFMKVGSTVQTTAILTIYKQR